MPPKLESLQHLTRRCFLKSAGQFSLGAIALSSLMKGNLLAGLFDASKPPLTPRHPHHTPKCKRVIYLHLSGGPPHLDLFDYKPDLVKWNDQLCPDEFLK